MNARRRNRGSALKVVLIVVVALILLIVICVWGFMRFGVPRVASTILGGVTGEDVAVGKVLW